MWQTAFKRRPTAAVARDIVAGIAESPAVRIRITDPVICSVRLHDSPQIVRARDHQVRSRASSARDEIDTLFVLWRRDSNVWHAGSGLEIELGSTGKIARNEGRMLSA